MLDQSIGIISSNKIKLKFNLMLRNECLVFPSVYYIAKGGALYICFVYFGVSVASHESMEDMATASERARKGERERAPTSEC